MAVLGEARLDWSRLAGSAAGQTLVLPGDTTGRGGWQTKADDAANLNYLLTLYSNPVLGHNVAMRFHLRPGDDPINSSGIRNEHSTSYGGAEYDGSWAYYAIGFYIPADGDPFGRGDYNWQTWSQWAIMWQVHDGTSTSGLSPPLSLCADNNWGAYSNNVLYIDRRSNSGARTTYVLANPLPKGTWIKVILRVEWSSTNGAMQAWYATGANAFPATPQVSVSGISNFYSGDTGGYRKMGIYAGNDAGHTLYHRGYLRTDTLQKAQEWFGGTSTPSPVITINTPTAGSSHTGTVSYDVAASDLPAGTQEEIGFSPAGVTTGKSAASASKTGSLAIPSGAATSQTFWARLFDASNNQIAEDTAAISVAASGGGGGTTTPTVVGFNATQAAAASYAIPSPANLAVGDIIVAAFSSAAGPTSATWPAGWTEVYDTTWASGRIYTVAWKRHDGSALGTLTLAGTAPSWGGVATVAIRNAVASGSPIDVQSATPTLVTSGTTITVPALTSTANNELALALIALNDSYTVTDPAGWTLHGDAGYPYVWSKEIPTAGSTGSAAPTISTAQPLAGALLVIKGAGTSNNFTKDLTAGLSFTGSLSRSKSATQYQRSFTASISPGGTIRKRKTQKAGTAPALGFSGSLTGTKVAPGILSAEFQGGGRWQGIATITAPVVGALQGVVFRPLWHPGSAGNGRLLVRGYLTEEAGDGLSAIHWRRGDSGWQQGTGALAPGDEFWFWVTGFEQGGSYEVEIEQVRASDSFSQNWVSETITWPFEVRDVVDEWEELYAPEWMAESTLRKSVYRAVGMLMADIHTLLDDIAMQQDPARATWALPWWEQQLAMPNISSLPIPERQAAVSARRRGGDGSRAAFYDLIESVAGSFSISDEYDLYQVTITIPGVADNTRRALIEHLAENVKPAGINLVVAYSGGFQLDVSELDADTF